MKEIIEKWKKEANITYIETTVIHVEEDKLYIITKYPGLFIGYHGNLVDKYSKLINKEIVFIDMFFGDVIEF